ncbi:magnesium transporter [Mariniblastus fucicola]|uniref:Magnesium transporter MgtE n=1 Tax=Mariniblastus fucicola TaxID=980251 RepID=A0A5B9PB96_9BACT|nr:magnesium transporter [Mariniblastus fucicola]QEG20391.1 Magnesium transporter MgtE [Mariniblastus fucicola]
MTPEPENAATEKDVDEVAMLAALTDQIEASDFGAAQGLLEDMDARSRSRLLSRLPSELQQLLVTHIAPEQAADFIHEMPEVQARDILEEIDPSQAADILEELPKKEQADFVGELPKESMDAILSEMEAEDASAIRLLATYDDDEAGGIMTVKFFAVAETETVGQVIGRLRDNIEEFSDFDVQYAYVVDVENHLIGVLRLRDLLVSRDEVKIATLMIKDPLFVSTHTKLPELHQIFDAHSFFGIPVVNELNLLVGVLRRGDVEESMSEQFQDDYEKAQGLISEEIRAMPTVTRARRRLSWLSINIVLNIIAASVIAFYQDTLEQVIALAVFLPIISDMSGCSGNQAVAVSMRELSLGLVEPKEVVRVWLKEISVGLINGLALGLLIASVALLWKGNPWLGLVVGVAMMLNTIIAVSLGGTLPLVMRRLNLDPALASGPILTTVTDMCGFFLVLSGASIFLSYLV